VIRYSYLWAREAAEGREEGIKDRPCAVVLVVVNAVGGQMVRVLPVTHTPPANPDDALEIPSPVKHRLGLDHIRSWVVVTEANDFVRPGPDLRLAISGDPSSAAYGYLPPRFFEAVKQRLGARRGKLITRTE
jgi:hypothetical protein